MIRFSLLLASLACPVSGATQDVYTEDVAFALDEIEKRCERFFDLKDIDWKKVRKEFSAAAKKVETDEDHTLLMQRLLARLKDGHAELRPVSKDAPIAIPEEWKIKKVSPGFTLCRIDGDLYVRNAYSSAAEVGLEPGMRVIKVDGQAAAKWLAEREEEFADTGTFSTDQHRFFATCRWGFARPAGERIKLEIKERSKKKKVTVTYDRASSFNQGPAFLLEGLSRLGNQDSLRWCRTSEGFGYINVRRIKANLLDQVDAALADLADCPGLILDFRGNSGGGCDHDALEARFIPAGKSMPRMARAALASAGPTPYGGPIVVIVDATVVSAGETTSGMFKEDGRAYMIGESATAGMSSSKEIIELPSGKLAMRVSVRSNRSSFNRGRGIEGIGVAPQELVEFDPEELAEGVDSLIRRACELLQDFPQKEVKYDPQDYGWTPQ